MWKALFGAVTAVFTFLGKLVSKSPAEPEPVDAAAARAGTAAGAAADHASNTAGPITKR